VADVTLLAVSPCKHVDLAARRAQHTPTPPPRTCHDPPACRLPALNDLNHKLLVVPSRNDEQYYRTDPASTIQNHGKPIAKLRNHTRAVSHLAWSITHDAGTRLLTASDDDTVAVYSVSHLTPHTFTVRATLSSHGRFNATRYTPPRALRPFALLPVRMRCGAAPRCVCLLCLSLCACACAYTHACGLRPTIRTRSRRTFV
jgi:WD40 repeat protein